MTVHHGAMDTRYGLLIRHSDGSWSPHMHSLMAGLTLAAIKRLLEFPPYDLPLDHFRIVKWTALALCEAPDCKGHDDPDWQCPPPLAPQYPEGTHDVNAASDQLASGIRTLAKGGWRDR